MSNVVQIPVRYLVLMGRCAGCDNPMHPLQNVRAIGPGRYVCIPCHEKMRTALVHMPSIVPLHRSWWRRVLDRFRRPRIPAARTLSSRFD